MLGMLGSFDRCKLVLRINVGNVRNECWEMLVMLGSFDEHKYMNV